MKLRVRVNSLEMIGKCEERELEKQQIKVCVFAWDLCQFSNLSALNRVFCCPCKLRAMGFSAKLHLIRGAMLSEFN